MTVERQESAPFAGRRWMRCHSRRPMQLSRRSRPLVFAPLTSRLKATSEFCERPLYSEMKRFETCEAVGTVARRVDKIERIVRTRCHWTMSSRRYSKDQNAILTRGGSKLNVRHTSVK